MRNIIILCLVSILILPGCRNRNNDSTETVSYTIATLKGPSSMGMIALIDSLERTQGSNISVKILDEPVQVRKMMLDGSADFALLPATTAAILYNKGLDYRLVAIPVWGTLYLFGSDPSIKEWKDLKNKKVNLMGRGMTPDILFRYLLKKNGLDPEKDLELDYSFPTHIDLANAVAAGRVKLGVISEPLVSLVMQKNKNVRPIMDLNGEWSKVESIPVASTALMVKASLIRKNPKFVEQIISAYSGSSKWVITHPDSAAALIVKYNIVPGYDVALSSIPRSNLNFVRANDIKADIYKYLKIFYELDPETIGGKMPDENFIY
jgi:NitT/TauT family transport system substrate-binding protein